MRAKLIITSIAHWSGSATTVVIALISLIIYVVVGLIIGFTESYNLIANTVMSAIAYLLLFVIQYTQNLDGRATQLKLDEIISSLKHANNQLIKVEELDEKSFIILEQELRDRKKVWAVYRKAHPDEILRDEPQNQN